MDTTHQDNLLELERRLEETQEWLNTISAPTFMGIKMRLQRHLMQDLNYVRTMTGNSALMSSIADGTHHDKKDLTLGPKSIMGKAIELHQPVTRKDFTPTKNEKAKFIANVTDLYNAFIDLKDSDVQAIISKPGGIALLRGVAKKANVSDWDSLDDSEIDTAFFADIREGIKANAKSDVLNGSIKTKLAKDNVLLNSEEDADDEAEVAKTPAAKKKAAVAKAPAAKKSAPKKNSPSSDDYE